MSPDHNTESVLLSNTRCVMRFLENGDMAKPGKTSDFWMRLARARERKGLTMDQQAIAKELGIFQSAVTKWKTGLGLPKLATAIKLATGAGVCVDWLLTGRPPELPGAQVDPELTRLLGFWEKLSEDLKKEIVGFAVFKRSTTASVPLEKLKEVEEKFARKDVTRGHPKAPGF